MSDTIIATLKEAVKNLKVRLDVKTARFNHHTKEARKAREEVILVEKELAEHEEFIKRLQGEG